jgi:glycosyltransferase involved in cell wall biosynthesis
MKRAAKLKFVYWFTFYNLNSPTVRYRGKYTVDYLREHYGINSYFIIPGYGFRHVMKFMRAYFSALFFPGKNSVIVIQSVYSNGQYATALKFLVAMRRKYCVYDMDDADYLRYPPKTIYHFLKNCSTVILGSTELVKNLSKFNPRTILITCPVPDLNIIKREKNEVLTIGWIGDFTKGHKESLLNIFFPAINNLPFRIKLIMLGVERKEEHLFLTDFLKGFKNVEGCIMHGIDWNDERAIQKTITTFDIGIATLLDNEFYRSKSAFKLKQYLTAGVPVLSSDLPENNRFVVHAVNGFLCNKAEDFRQRIIQFHEMNQKDYKVLSKNARTGVSGFDLRNFCEGLISAHKTMY